MTTFPRVSSGRDNRVVPTRSPAVELAAWSLSVFIRRISHAIMKGFRNKVDEAKCLSPKISRGLRLITRFMLP